MGPLTGDIFTTSGQITVELAVDIHSAQWMNLHFLVPLFEMPFSGKNIFPEPMKLED